MIYNIIVLFFISLFRFYSFRFLLKGFIMIKKRRSVVHFSVIFVTGAQQWSSQNVTVKHSTIAFKQ